MSTLDCTTKHRIQTIPLLNNDRKSVFYYQVPINIKLITIHCGTKFQ